MNRKSNHDVQFSIDSLLQEDALSVQLSLPESIDDSLTLDGFPVIPNQGSTAEARLYFAQLQESIRKIERLEQERRNCLEAIQSGPTPTDDEFEYIRNKDSHELSFQEIFWKILYDTMLRQRSQRDIQQKFKVNDGDTKTMIKNKGLEPFDAQSKIQELQTSLLEIKRTYLTNATGDATNVYDEDVKKLKTLNEDLRHEHDKHQRALMECKSSNLELERKIQILEKENLSLLREKEKYVADLDKRNEDYRRIEVELQETKTQLEHLRKYSIVKLQDTGIKETHAATHSSWINEKEDLLKPLERKVGQLQCELHERNAQYVKLEIVSNERGKQLKDYQNQIDMLQEQISVLKREFENLEKESLMERKRLNDDILRRDEQLEMYLESKISYDELLQKDETVSPFQSPPKLKNNQDHNECCHCRHLLTHTVVLGKKCKGLQVKINELETKNIQQQATAETDAAALRYKNIIHRLEGQVIDLQKKNDVMRIEHECSYADAERRPIPKRKSSKNHAIHHIFILPQQKVAEYSERGHDAKSIHLEYRGPGSFRVKR